MRIINILKPRVMWMAIVMGLTLLLSPTLMADDYNPTNPEDPYMRYKVVTTANPYGYTSGDGTYLSGDVAYISTSSYSTNYTFSHWTKNGVYYSDQESFSYTVEPQTTKFVAYYDYTPEDPSEPQASNQYRLYVTNNISSACSFNFTSGAKFEANDWVYIEAYYNSSVYEFQGWYNGSEKVSDAASFNFMMPSVNTTLTAKFIYSPTNPDDPGMTSQKSGDVDGDGEILISDAIEIINMIMQGKTATLSTSISDANNDGEINVSDAIEIINWIQQGTNN